MTLLADGDGPTISIVAPMYNEATAVAAFIDAVQAVMSPTGETYEIVLVDDGSSDATWDAIDAAAADNSIVKGVRLSRNFGHQNALFCGMNLAGGQAIVSLDGDLQHPPSLIPQMIELWRDGKRVVNTRRIDAEDTGAFKRLTSRWFYKLFSALSGLPVDAGSSDFRLIDRQVLAAIRDVRDADLFLRGVIRWVGFPAATLPYQAQARHSGTTKYTLRKMIRFASAGMVSFSVIPLRLGIYAGLAMGVLAVLEIIYVLVKYYQGVTSTGWASTIVLISVMFAVLFFLLGIIGQYLASIFEILKNRPRYIVHETTDESRTHTPSADRAQPIAQ